MKLVTHYVDPGDATRAKNRLREAGVSTEVKIVDPHISRPSRSGANRIGLWVVFDDQFEDAVRLLENPELVPERANAVDQMAEERSLSHGFAPGSTIHRFRLAAIIVFLACLLGLSVYLVAGVFNGV